jgi:hypothetical protein
MGEQAYRAFEQKVDRPDEPAWIMPARPLTNIDERLFPAFRPAPRQVREDEADYCRARAAAEARRADEAAHPAARAAHAELAARYRERALAAQQVEAGEIQDWMNEGGSWRPGG